MKNIVIGKSIQSELPLILDVEVLLNTSVATAQKQNHYYF